MGIGDLAIDRGADNKLKYNGKELQDDVLNGVKLNLYAYGARYYMPDVPVFTTQDPLTEWFSDQSPYLYAYNNPIRFTDFKGMNAKDKVKKEKDPEKKKEKRRFFFKKDKDGNDVVDDVVDVVHEDVVYKPNKADKKRLKKYKKIKKKVARFEKGKIRNASRFESWLLRNADGETLNEVLNALFGTNGSDGASSNTLRTTQFWNVFTKKNYPDAEFDFNKETTNGENTTDNMGKQLPKDAFIHNGDTLLLDSVPKNGTKEGFKGYYYYFKKKK